MGNPYVIVGHDELINNNNHTSGNSNNNSLNERNYFSSSWLCGGSSYGKRGYGTMRYFCSVSLFYFIYFNFF